MKVVDVGLQGSVFDAAESETVKNKKLCGFSADLLLGVDRWPTCSHM